MLAASLLMVTTVFGVALGDTFSVAERHNAEVPLAPEETECTTVQPSAELPKQPSVEMPVAVQSTVAQGDTVPKGSAAGKMGAKDPKNFSTEVQYNPKTNDYLILKKIGDVVIDRQYMTFEEYQNYQMGHLMQNYWSNKTKTAALDKGSGSSNNILDNIPGLNKLSGLAENLLGPNAIQINPSGSAELTFAVVNNKREDPAIDVNKRSVTNFDFDENIQINLNAKIGDLVDFDINQNTQAVFDFENTLKLKHEGKEDDILQLIEAGNIAMPLNTKLIQGSQSLFGFHTKLKFGKLTIDGVFSEQKTESQNLQVQGGAQTEEFQIKADEYEENRHFFLAQYFYDNYNKAMSTLPVLNSNINIIKIEVWRTNVGAAVSENRNIVAITDLGEKNPSMSSLYNPSGRTLPSDNSNNLFGYIDRSAVRSVNQITPYMQSKGFVSGRDYEKVESARKLSPSEYTFNPQLGFISLNQALSADQVLAVAFQYQVIGDTTVYQVGELTTDGIVDPNTLVVKLLKSTTINTKSPLWKLMMKNVYFLKSTQISPDKFRLNVLYEGDDGGVLTGYYADGPKKGVPLIEVFGLDRMDAMQYPYADGVFDWLDNASTGAGIIQASTGRVFFPYVEPFGKDLREILGDNAAADKYCFDSLYTLTKTLAQQYPDKDKYYLEGSYSTAMSGEISLGFNIPEGSVRVTAGGIPLVEGVDYTVDYMMGKVRIINESVLSSGTPISISSESNSFSMMTKRMMGMHLNYEFNPKFNLGATILNLHQRPLTQKNNFGDEPLNNTIWGLDLSFEHEMPWLTKAIDWLPGISTKDKSTLTLNAEFAHFIPGMSKTNESGTSYIDDFEGAKSGIDLKNVSSWHLASTPQDWSTPNAMFPETRIGSGLEYGFNRARLAWYRIDDIFYSSNAPSNIGDADRSRPYARRISEQEVFPNKELAAGETTNIYELNLAFYPDEKGPYNYDVNGLNSDGKLENPASRWGGIMRKLDYTDFETQNIETIEFWLMDPFIDNPNHSGGKLYFNLGDISEDILRDGRKFFENGLPTGNAVINVDTTIWGRVPTIQSVVNAFDNDEDARMRQDIGYDGLSSADERTFFESYLQALAQRFGTQSAAYQNAYNDPSSDDFTYFRSSRYDNSNVKINDRYKYYNNAEGNSAPSGSNGEDYPTAATSYPNGEDINNDNTLSESENYYQYSIDLSPENMVIGQNYITDIQEAQNIKLPDGSTTTCKWYQFKIPVRNPEKKVGSIEGYQSIRFMRMFMREFNEPIILRFATLELVYGTWRKYDQDLYQPGDIPTGGDANTKFTTSTVNIEENGYRSPVPYVLPPGIDREEWYSNSSYYQMNEQSLQMEVSDLASGDARAIYKNAAYDLRYFGSLKMFAHAEKLNETDDLKDGDLTLFVRLGNDFTRNYYEYELPLKLTPWGTSMSQDDVIWPEANNVEIDLEKLVAVKENRNKQIRSGNAQFSNTDLYTEYDGGRKYTVLGTPNIGAVKVIMIGVRNPRKQSATDGNDMLPKSAIVWINELRLGEFSRKSGWAAMALARTNLANLGDLSLYGAYTSSRFGSLEQNISDLDGLNNANIEVALNLDLDKFLPEEWGLKIPVHFDHSTQIGTPEYNPLDPDVNLRRDIRSYLTGEERDSIRNMTREHLSRTNINLVNLHKERTGKAATQSPHFYQIENFNFSYAFSGEKSSDVDVEYYNKKQHRGGFTYNFNVTPKQVKPFDNIKFFQNKYLKFIRDLNFYYQPKSLSFRTEVFRDFQETKLRNKSAGDIIIKPTFYKQFTWERVYNLQYDITKTLRLQYDANANADVEEPMGKIDTRTKTDSVWQSVLEFGRMRNFSQNLSVTWDFPIERLPYLDFLRTPLSYKSTYVFTGSTPSTQSLGNTIENTATLNATVNATMKTLYDKFKFIKKAYQPKQSKDAKGKGPMGNRQGGNNKNKNDKKNGKGKDKDKLETVANADTIPDSTKNEKWKEILREVGYFGIRAVTGLKNFSVKYTLAEGTLIPGFMPEATLLGMDNSSLWSPGLAFVFGGQNDIVAGLLENDYLSKDTLLNSPHQVRTNDVLAIQAVVEPIRDLKIDISLTRNFTSQGSHYYKYNNNLGYIDGPLSPTRFGSYSTTICMFGTAFDDADELFAQFLDSRAVVAGRLAALNPDPFTDEYLLDSLSGLVFPGGYSPNSQQVLLTSFLATYLGRDVHSMGFSPFLGFPLPNWSITYNGLNKVEWLKKWFSNISLSHRYSSTYTVSNYSTDMAISNIDGYDYGMESVLNASNDFIPKESIDQIQLTEQFQPFLKVDVVMVNSMQFNVAYQRARTLTLSFSNNQLTEMSRNGFTVGAGYRIKDVAFTITTGQKTHNLKSDIVIQANLSYNQNKTQIRKIAQNTSQISSGSEVWTGGLSAEYALSQSLTVRLFFETTINRPFISNSYPNSTTKGGLTVRFSF